MLMPMAKPTGFNRVPVRPLIMFWEAIGPKAVANDHLFRVCVTYDFLFDRPSSWPKTGTFDTLWVFSASSYLRCLKDDHVRLVMPNAAHRLRTLNQLFVGDPGG